MKWYFIEDTLWQSVCSWGKIVQTGGRWWNCSNILVIIQKNSINVKWFSKKKKNWRLFFFCKSLKTEKGQKQMCRLFLIHFKLSGKQRRFIILTLLFISSLKLRDEEFFHVGLRAYFMFLIYVFFYQNRHPVFSAKHPSGWGDVGFSTFTSFTWAAMTNCWRFYPPL